MKAKETREQMMRVEGQMCVVERHLGGGKGEALGSGFLIGPDVVLTNYHVVDKYIEGGLPLTLQVRFDALPQEDGLRQPKEGVTVAVDEILDVFGPYQPTIRSIRRKRQRPTSLTSPSCCWPRMQATPRWAAKPDRSKI